MSGRTTPCPSFWPSIRGPPPRAPSCFGADVSIAAIAQTGIPATFPGPGWVEHDPEDIWRHRAACRDAIAKAGLRPRDIAAIGITNQRETTIVWERATGQPIHNAIVWQDRRTAASARKLRDGPRGVVRRKTGLLLDPYFSGTKVAWLLDHVPGARARAERGELAVRHRRYAFCCGG